MKAIVIEQINRLENDKIYEVGEEIEVEELMGFTIHYARFYDETMDWIPKDKVKIIS